jgi:hypothetical protein
MVKAMGDYLDFRKQYEEQLALEEEKRRNLALARDGSRSDWAAKLPLDLILAAFWLAVFLAIVAGAIAILIDRG